VALLLMLLLMGMWVPVFGGGGAILAVGSTYLVLVVALWSALWQPVRD
jgi:hypothetical protein